MEVQNDDDSVTDYECDSVVDDSDEEELFTNFDQLRIMV